MTGRPICYEPGRLLRWMRPIRQATDYACGRRLAAKLPEWIPAYEAHEQSLPGEVREKLLGASSRTLDRLLEPLRVAGAGRSLTRPGTVLRQQIPIGGSVWEDGKAGRTNDRKLVERRLMELQEQIGHLSFADDAKLTFAEVAKEGGWPTTQEQDPTRHCA
jgi:hypothetical protein